jgi:hypothetical protein
LCKEKLPITWGLPQVWQTGSKSKRRLELEDRNRENMAFENPAFSFVQFDLMQLRSTAVTDAGNIPASKQIFGICSTLSY